MLWKHYWLITCGEESLGACVLHILFVRLSLCLAFENVVKNMDLAILKERIVSLILSESLKEELEEAVKSKHVSILLVAFFFCKQCHEGIFMHNLKLEVMGSSVYLCTRWPQHTIKMGDLTLHSTCVKCQLKLLLQFWSKHWFFWLTWRFLWVSVPV